jgi:hypothetical protein
VHHFLHYNTWGLALTLACSIGVGSPSPPINSCADGSRRRRRVDVVVVAGRVMLPDRHSTICGSTISLCCPVRQRVGHRYAYCSCNYRPSSHLWQLCVSYWITSYRSVCTCCSTSSMTAPLGSTFAW